MDSIESSTANRELTTMDGVWRARKQRRQVIATTMDNKKYW